MNDSETALSVSFAAFNLEIFVISFWPSFAGMAPLQPANAQGYRAATALAHERRSAQVRSTSQPIDPNLVGWGPLKTELEAQLAVALLAQQTTLRANGSAATNWNGAALDFNMAVRTHWQNGGDLQGMKPKAVKHLTDWNDARAKQLLQRESLLAASAMHKAALRSTGAPAAPAAHAAVGQPYAAACECWQHAPTAAGSPVPHVPPQLRAAGMPSAPPVLSCWSPPAHVIGSDLGGRGGQKKCTFCSNYIGWTAKAKHCCWCAFAAVMQPQPAGCLPCPQPVGKICCRQQRGGACRCKFCT